MKTLCLGIFILSLTQTSFAKHSFDDLDEAEMKQAITLIKTSGKFSDEIRFPVLRTEEPRKSMWLSGQATGERKAYAAVYDTKKGLMTEVVVDLKNQKVLSQKDLPGISPPVLVEEYERARQIVKADERWQNAIKKRGLALEDVLVDLWAPGLMTDAESKAGQRLLRGVTYMNKSTKNFYSRPVVVSDNDCFEKPGLKQQ